MRQVFIHVFIIWLHLDSMTENHLIENTNNTVGISLAKTIVCCYHVCNTCSGKAWGLYDMNPIVFHKDNLLFTSYSYFFPTDHGVEYLPNADVEKSADEKDPNPAWYAQLLCISLPLPFRFTTSLVSVRSCSCLLTTTYSHIFLYLYLFLSLPLSLSVLPLSLSVFSLPLSYSLYLSLFSLSLYLSL